MTATGEIAVAVDKVPVEMSGEHPVEGAVGHDQVQGVTDKGQPLGQAGLRSSHH